MPLALSSILTAVTPASRKTCQRCITAFSAPMQCDAVRCDLLHRETDERFKGGDGHLTTTLCGSSARPRERGVRAHRSSCLSLESLGRLMVAACYGGRDWHRLLGLWTRWRGVWCRCGRVGISCQMRSRGTEFRAVGSGGRGGGCGAFARE